MRLRLSLTAAVCLTLAHAASAQVRDTLPSHARQFITGGPLQWWGDTRAALIARFGPPDSTQSRIRRNAYDTLSIDTVVTHHYAGATFVYYVASSLHRDLFEEATVWAPQYLDESPLKLGATVAVVRTYFADASHGSTPLMVYEAGELATRLELWFTDDRLVRLRWQYPID